MRRYFLFSILFLAGFLMLMQTTLEADEAEIGKSAPAFTATDINARPSQSPNIKARSLCWSGSIMVVLM